MHWELKKLIESRLLSTSPLCIKHQYIYQYILLYILYSNSESKSHLGLLSGHQHNTSHKYPATSETILLNGLKMEPMVGESASMELTAYDHHLRIRSPLLHHNHIFTSCNNNMTHISNCIVRYHAISPTMHLDIKYYWFLLEVHSSTHLHKVGISVDTNSYTSYKERHAVVFYVLYNKTRHTHQTYVKELPRKVMKNIERMCDRYWFLRS